MSMDAALDRLVRERALQCCEHCRMPQSVRLLRFVIDHIIALQHNGQTGSENLAPACGRCNRHKGPNIAGLDPTDRQLSRLFNPREDAWRDHFRFDGAVIRPLTPIGRVTEYVLQKNHPDDVAVREELLIDGPME